MDLVQEIVENLEPDAWDWGQLDEPDDLPAPPPAAPAAAPTPEVAPIGREPPAGAPPPPAPGALPRNGAAPDPAAAPPIWPPRRYVSPHKVAIIRYWRDCLVVHAPDYIHREINGSPEPIPPPGLAAGE